MKKMRQDRRKIGASLCVLSSQLKIWTLLTRPLRKCRRISRDRGWAHRRKEAVYCCTAVNRIFFFLQSYLLVSCLCLSNLRWCGMCGLASRIYYLYVLEYGMATHTNIMCTRYSTTGRYEQRSFQRHLFVEVGQATPRVDNSCPTNRLCSSDEYIIVYFRVTKEYIWYTALAVRTYVQNRKRCLYRCCCCCCYVVLVHTAAAVVSPCEEINEAKRRVTQHFNRYLHGRPCEPSNEISETILVDEQSHPSPPDGQERG